MNPSPELEDWTKDWRRLRRQKHRQQGGIEGAMLYDVLLYEGEHQSVQVQNAILTRAFKNQKDKNKLRLVFNFTRRLVNRKVGRLWSIAHEYTATPNTKDPRAYDRADLVGRQLVPALDYKAQQGTLRWELMAWLLKCGVVFEHCDWKEGVTKDVMPKYVEGSQELLWKDSLTGTELPESQVKLLLQSGRVAGERFSPAVEVQEEGEFGSDIYDPFRVFVDASVTQVKKLGPGQAIYLADIRTAAWVKDTFGSEAGKNLQRSKDLSIIETQLLDRGIPVSGLNLKDFLPLIQGSHDKDDPDMCIVLTRYQAPDQDNPKGTRCFFVPDQDILDSSENPYPEIPIVDYHWSAPGGSMWTTGFIRDLQAPQKFANKRFSQLGEAANASIYEMLLLGGDLKAKDIPTDFPGVVEGGMSDEGIPLVQQVPRGNLPSFFPESIKLVMESIDMLGSSDLLSQRKFPGQLRGSLAIPMIQEILDSEDGPVFTHLGEQFSREKEMRLNRVQQFYPPIRTLVYAGEDERHEVLEFHKDELMPVGTSFTISVAPGTLLPELPSMREARVRERMQWAPGLYTNDHTGQVDWTAVAQDLKYNDRHREDNRSLSRKLARQLMQRVRSGKLSTQVGEMNPETGRPQIQLIDGETQQPFIIYPFWEHIAMLDEYKSQMMTTEFLDASPEFKRAMLALYEGSRTVVAKIEEARQNSIESKMVQGAVAQATQQAAAKTVGMAVDAAMAQVESQNEQAGDFSMLEGRIRQLLSESMANGGAPGGQPGPAGAPPLQAGRRQLTPGGPMR